MSATLFLLIGLYMENVLFFTSNKTNESFFFLLTIRINFWAYILYRECTERGFEIAPKKCNNIYFP